MRWAAIGVSAAIGWYIWNAARAAWREGNHGGAAAVALFALTAVAVPVFLLLWNQ
ncbi:MAG TPA: hypothetical protein VD902_21010 [Symbiobacteriaceae bacterium]|nr:hypothetical protein [Symbiobacteriaceae bacterium]